MTAFVTKRKENPVNNYVRFLLEQYDMDFKKATEHTYLEDVVITHGKVMLEEVREVLKDIEKQIGDVKAEEGKTSTKKSQRKQR